MTETAKQKTERIAGWIAIRLSLGIIIAAVFLYLSWQIYKPNGTFDYIVGRFGQSIATALWIKNDEPRRAEGVKCFKENGGMVK
jgi:hypothetical protein